MATKGFDRIGTPESPSATRVMLLGAGELGKEVIIAFQRLGVEVIAVDRYANAPGHQVAHKAVVIDMSDPAALRELIEREKPHRVIPEIEAIATSVLIELEKSGLEVIPTAKAAFLTMNREGIRRLAAEELNLPTSKYRFAVSEEEMTASADALGYPCFVKPIMSSSGKGQSKLASTRDCSEAWMKAKSAARVDMQKVIVEAAIDFDFEITLLTVRSLDKQGQPVVSYCEPVGHLQVNGDYVESWQPQPMSEKSLLKAQAIAASIVNALGGLGIFGVELFVKGDEVWFSEVSPRPHDTGMVTMSSQVQNEFELHARAILGLPVNTSLRRPGASAVIYGGMDAKAIAFEGVAEALRIPESDLRLFGKPESFVKRRMGVALANAETVDEARDRAKMVATKVRPVRT
ncbi:MAG: formate-dependent phosphoribosylglycinamide formyltransferase [Pseudomonadota bacterium]